MADTSKLLEALSSYTGDQTSLESFVTVAKNELGAEWTNTIYQVLPNLPAHLKEKLDHAFNYYGASLSWTEIQSYLTSEEALNVAEVTNRLETLSYWLKFFGQTGEAAVEQLKQKLATAAEKENTAIEAETEIEVDNFTQMQEDYPSEPAQDKIYNDPIQEDTYQDASDQMTVPLNNGSADEGYTDEKDADNNYSETDYAENDYQANDYQDTGYDPSYEEPYQNDGYQDAGYSDESYAENDYQANNYQDDGYQDTGYDSSYEEPYQDDGYQYDYQTQNTNEDLNNEADYMDYQSDETLGYDNRYANQPFDMPSYNQDSYISDGFYGSNGGANGYSDEQFYGSTGEQDGYFDQTGYGQSAYNDGYDRQDAFEQDDDFWQEPVYQKQQNETIEEFMAKKTFHQVDFLNAVHCWINARCIQLGNKEIYAYRHYGFLIDLMEEAKKDVQEVLSDPKYYPAIENVRANGLKKLQRIASSLESDLKIAYDNLPSELTDLISDETQASDLKAMLGAIDTSNTPELLGAAPDGFEMLEDPFAGTSIEKELKKKSKPTTPAGTPSQQKKSGLSFNKKPVAQ